jgi:hypothetical protein
MLRYAALVCMSVGCPLLAVGGAYQVAQGKGFDAWMNMLVGVVFGLDLYFELCVRKK